jgi:hypothetical protein
MALTYQFGGESNSGSPPDGVASTLPRSNKRVRAASSPDAFVERVMLGRQIAVEIGEVPAGPMSDFLATLGQPVAGQTGQCRQAYVSLFPRSS